MISFDNVDFILIGTTHPGNIGACARAMKNMSLENLSLVSPLHFPHDEATARSSGAENILEKARVVGELQEAISESHLVFGTSSRKRSLPNCLVSAREAAQLTREALLSNQKVAFLFGQERTGLTNAELSVCHYHVYIPSDPTFSSLNLAAAVQVIAYEIYTSLLNTPFNEHVNVTSSVTSEQMRNFYLHLEESLIQIGFLDPKNPRQLMQKLRRLFNRIFLEPNELNILRGILTAIGKSDRC